MPTYYISPSGNDTTGSGTIGAPWLTVSKAFTSSIAGDTIYCLAGVHTWVSQNYTSHRIVTADSASTTSFDGGAGTPTWQMTGSALDISNLKFFNADRGYPFGTFLANAVGTLSMQNCIIDGILGTSDRTIISVDAAVTTNILVRACLFLNLKCNYFGSEASTKIGNFSIYNNTFYANVADVDTPCFSDNTGVAVAHNFDLRNNIIVNDNGTPKVFVWTGSSGATFTGAVAASNIIRGYSSIPAALSAALSSDPLFVSVGSGNFNLRPNSPAMDAGVLI